MSAFYGIYLAEPWCSTMVDLIRIVCDPTVDERCHITLRGPYKREKRDQRRLWSRLGDQMIDLVGLGNFFQANQNTIFIRVELADSDIIWKPHYPDSPAHITIYDGRDAEFAHKLFGSLFYTFDFQATVRTGGMLLLQDKAHPFADDLLLDSELTQLGTSVREISSDISHNRRIELATIAAARLRMLLDMYGRIKDSSDVEEQHQQIWET